MKKLIAIAVVFVLAVGIAFAADIGVDVIGNVVPIKGDSQDGSPVTVGGSFGRIRISASGENEDGNFGGYLRYDASYSGSPNAWGYVWWKPHDIFKLTLGNNNDGFLDGVDGVTRWAYYQIAGDVGVASEDWSSTGFGQSFFPGDNRPGAFMTLTPLEPLAISVAIPFIAENSGEAKDVYKKLVGQVTYNLGSIGKLALTYKGDLNKDGDDGSKLWAYFGLSAIENLGIDLGVGYTLPVNIRGTDDVKTGNIYSAPVALGLGVHFITGALGIKARVQALVAGNYKPSSGDAIKDDTFIKAGLMPYFAVTDKVTAYLSTGLDMTNPDVGDTTVGWHIEPYVSVKANAWAPNFYAGIKFDSDGVKDAAGKTTVNWSIPVGIWVGF